MHGRSSRDVLRHLRTLYRFGVIGDLTDEQLLQSFVSRDEAADEAFAILVERHGSMVLGVCLRFLDNNAHEAEDAFQATFLILARKASSLSRRDKLASWLYGTAVRTASESRRRNARRKLREQRASAPIRVEPRDDALTAELRTILDEELARLPELHRVAVILCELEGLSRTEAARRLGVPEGTLSSRLSRAKIQLRDRLTRRGIALSTLTISTALIRRAQAIPLPLSLIESTVAAATRVASGTSVATTITLAIPTLTKGAFQTMFVTKLKATAWAVGAIATVASGVMVLGQPGDQPAATVYSAVPSAAVGVAQPGAKVILPPPVAQDDPSPVASHLGRSGTPVVRDSPILPALPAAPQYRFSGTALARNFEEVAKVDPRVPSPSASPKSDERAAALEKKLDKILTALDRLSGPDKLAAAAGNDDSPTVLAEPPLEPMPAAKPNTSDTPRVPITNRLDTLESKLEKASQRMSSFERRIKALERMVGVTDVQQPLEPVAPSSAVSSIPSGDLLDDLNPIPKPVPAPKPVAR
jgi:RNA polymerase sigma factor (sigma-70 family)